MHGYTRSNDILLCTVPTQCPLQHSPLQSLLRSSRICVFVFAFLCFRFNFHASSFIYLFILFLAFYASSLFFSFRFFFWRSFAFSFFFFFWRLHFWNCVSSFSEICVFVLQQKQKRCKSSNGQFCMSQNSAAGSHSRLAAGVAVIGQRLALPAPVHDVRVVAL